MTTPPSVAFWSPAMMDNTVDLPHPECPRMQTNSRSRIRAFTFFTATYWPEGVSNTLLSPVSSRGGIIFAPLSRAMLRPPSGLRAVWHERSRQETPQSPIECEQRQGHAEVARRTLA